MSLVHYGAPYSAGGTASSCVRNEQPATGRTSSIPRRLLLLVIFLTALPCGAWACGWSYVDHVVSYDDSGMWNPNVYRSIVGALTIAQIGGALWEGSDTRFGKTMWQGIDAEIVSGASAAVGKRIFTRVRPDNGGDPCLWFQGGSNYSFPSGEAAVSAALVTPYILEYGTEHPATYALLALPLYIGAARIKNQDHWQTDVLAGWAVGGLSGWFTHNLDTPIMIRLLPHGAEVGLKTQF
jgi:membrane-associated phospholipid phosphatase